jgi:hypothetical protein
MVNVLRQCQLAITLPSPHRRTMAAELRKRESASRSRRFVTTHLVARGSQG